MATKAAKCTHGASFVTSKTRSRPYFRPFPPYPGYINLSGTPAQDIINLSIAGQSRDPLLRQSGISLEHVHSAIPNILLT